MKTLQKFLGILVDCRSRDQKIKYLGRVPTYPRILKYICLNTKLKWNKTSSKWIPLYARERQRYSYYTRIIALKAINSWTWLNTNEFVSACADWPTDRSVTIPYHLLTDALHTAFALCPAHKIFPLKNLFYSIHFNSISQMLQIIPIEASPIWADCLMFLVVWMILMQSVVTGWRPPGPCLSMSVLITERWLKAWLVILNDHYDCTYNVHTYSIHNFTAEWDSYYGYDFIFCSCLWQRCMYLRSTMAM